MVNPTELPWRYCHYLLSPKTRGWIVAPNYDMCDKIARLVKEVIMMKLRFPIVAKKEISGQLYYAKLGGLESEIAIRSADNLDSLVGEGLDYMVIDEAASIKKITWEQYLRPTLSDREGLGVIYEYSSWIQLAT